MIATTKQQLRDDIEMSRKKIKLYRESLCGIPGIYNRAWLLRQIEISENVILRLTHKLHKNENH